MKIEIIAGSPRQESISRRVALYLLDWFKMNSTHDVHLVDLHQWQLPPVAKVWGEPDEAPLQFQPLAQRIFSADAFILVTPEYNGSYSPALKNLLDHFPKQIHKPFGLVTASPGAMGGMRAAQQLLLLVPALFGIASPVLLLTPHADKKFSAEGTLTDQGFEPSIQHFTSNFLWLAEKLLTEEVVTA